MPLGKVEIYGMGKVKMWPQEEYRNLQEMKQKQRKDFDRNPENQMRLNKIKKLRHNYERSQEMLESIKKVGLTDSQPDQEKIIDSLLEAGEQVRTEEARIQVTQLQAPNGVLKIRSTWKLLPDGTKYLTTIGFIPGELSP